MYKLTVRQIAAKNEFVILKLLMIRTIAFAENFLLSFSQFSHCSHCGFTTAGNNMGVVTERSTQKNEIKNAVCFQALREKVYVEY